MESMQDWQSLIVKAMSYTDLHGMARAATLMGMAQSDLWKKCASEAKRLHGKEINEAVVGLKKAWNMAVEPSNAAIKDVVAKVLQSHDIYPYPELLATILGSNPYQIRGQLPTYVETGGTTVEASTSPEVPEAPK